MSKRTTLKTRPPSSGTTSNGDVPLEARSAIVEALFGRFKPLPGDAGRWLAQYGIFSIADIESAMEKPGNDDFKKIVLSVCSEEMEGI